MGENEMKPKHGLPRGVRLTAGLDEAAARQHRNKLIANFINRS